MQCLNRDLPVAFQFLQCLALYNVNSLGNVLYYDLVLWNIMDRCWLENVERVLDTGMFINMFPFSMIVH